MWKLLNTGSQEYFVNVEFGTILFNMRIVISNFEDVWMAELDEEQLIATFKKSNPLIEVDTETLLKETKNLFVGENEVFWIIQVADKNLKLKVKSKLGPAPFNYEIDCVTVNNKIIFQTLVFPLLILLKGVQKQCEYLCDTIKKKDAEITEYKLDGAVLSRKTVETPKFEEDTLNVILNENSNNLCSMSFSGLLDEFVMRQLDEIKKLMCTNSVTRDAEKIGEENRKVDTPVKKPFKKKTVELIPEIEEARKNVSKLEKPAVIKKKAKVVKRLPNL